MGVRICYDMTGDVATLFDSCTGTAFGPVFQGRDCEERALSFCDYWEEHEPAFNMAFSTGPGGICNTTDQARLHNLWERWYAQASKEQPDTCTEF